MELSVGLALLLRNLLRVEYLKTLFHAGVVDTQELILCGSHVDKVGLALSAFLIEELVY